jgi:hypothetical protein
MSLKLSSFYRMILELIYLMRMPSVALQRMDAQTASEDYPMSKRYLQRDLTILVERFQKEKTLNIQYKRRFALIAKL